VDRHLVEVTAQAARLTTRVARPDLLLIGSLLHDIGKGRGGDHSVVGESLAVQVGRRLGFSEPDVEVLGAMVRHHLLLPHTATRRDLDDPATVTRVVETLQGAVDGGGSLLLELLESLAEADSLGTGPGVWSPWKRVLIGDLVRRCRALLAGEALPAPAAPGAPELELARAVAADGRPQLHVDDTGDPATVLVAMPDRVGSLAAAAGVLAMHSLEVHAAELYAASAHGGGLPASVPDGIAMFAFTVSPRFGGLPDPALMRSDLQRTMDGSLVLADALARKERDYAPMTPTGEAAAPPRVLWFDDEATGGVVLELRATDRIGLLHRVAAALEGCAADLRWARVSTLGASVVDSFCIGGDAAGTIAAAQRRRIEQAVLTAAR
jgi:[protein-PII] uridylyltransferase